jgi:predicted AlkP superfamily pyrophosphatase or phosphodiesterase
VRRVLVLNLVGLTPRLLESGAMPAVAAHARRHGLRALRPSLPAVTCTVQASMLFGAPPSVTGAVGNGWYFRDLAEVWLWRQSVRLVDGEGRLPSVFTRWRRAHPESVSAQLFWWWNLPSHADLSLTPRPTYWADGRKGPDVHAHPVALRARLAERLGPFPLFEFWGPRAGIGSTRWIADSALDVLREEHPGLTLVYLPHLDYDLQRHGPDGPEALRAAGAVDREAARLLAWAEAEDADAIVLSEYGITAARGAVEPNRALRREGLLAVHPAANGALLDPGNSRAFAVCDHQCAHVYVRDAADRPRVRALLAGLDGVERVYDGAELAALGLAHARSGELFLMAAPGRWFAYPYWLDERGDQEPDFARTVDIHRKPGYDPCELLLDPARPLLQARLGAKLLAKRLGFRTRFDPVPLDTALVRGTHGRPPDDAREGPVWIGPARLAPAGSGAITAEQALAGVAPD